MSRGYGRRDGRRRASTSKSALLEALQAHEDRYRPPPEPRPEAFGLTANTVTGIKARDSRLLERAATFTLAISWLSAAYLSWSWIQPDRLLQWGGTALLAFFLGWFGAVFVGVAFAIGSAIVDPLVRRLQPVRRRIAEYDAAVTKYRAWKERVDHGYWRALSPLGFEREVALHFREQGYQVALTPRTGDEGIDIFLERDGQRTAVQVKATRTPVGPGVLRELLGSAALAGTGRTMLVSRAGFTKGCRELARTSSVELVDLERILWERRRQEALHRS